MSREIYQAARKLVMEEGCSVVPIARGRKLPSIRWEIYQRRLPSDRELYQWFMGTENQLGLVTGNVSGGRFIVDFDGMICEETFQEFMDTFPEFLDGRVVQTGSGKPHIHGKCQNFPVDFTRKIKYYYDSEDQNIGEVELRGNRHQSLVPPSVHPCGTVYFYVDESLPVEVSRERFQEILNWMEIAQKEGIESHQEGENLEADDLSPEIRTKLADYYLKRIQFQVNSRHLNRNDKGYELARELNNLGLDVDEAKSLMRKYSDEAPYVVEKEPYTENEAMASLQSAYNNKRESPWIPWGFRDDIRKEKEVEEIRAEVVAGKDLRMIRPADLEPAPMDLSLPKVFKGFIKNISDVYARHLETPYEFWIFASATYLGNIFCGKIKIDSSLSTEPRIYMAGIGPSAVARKSESQRQLDKFFREYTESMDWGGEEPRRIVHTCNVGSAEGLISFLKKEPHSIYFLDELKSFIQKSDIKGSNLLQIVNSLFEDTRYENITKDSHLSVNDAHLSFMGFSTTETWDDMFSSTFTDIGFMNRLWIVPGVTDKLFSLPQSIHRDEKIPLFANLIRLVRNFGLQDNSLPPVTLELEWDAKWKWDAWYKGCERNDYTKRLDTYGLRFMQIMCLSEDTRVITQDVVERVIELLEWQRRVREIYFPCPYDTREAKIEGKIVRKLIEFSGRIGRSELYREIHGERVGMSIFNKAIKNLEDAKRIAVIAEPSAIKGGRPKDMVQDISMLNL